MTAIVRDEEKRTKIGVGEEALVFLSRTPFYAERGGQVGDTGLLLAEGTRFAVDDTIYPSGDLIGHRGKLLSGNLEVGMSVNACVDVARRLAIKSHHTATHLLHEALTRVLGKHVRQAGSLVTPTFLRFDYNHFAPLSQEEIFEIEHVIYERVLLNTPVVTRVTSYQEAKKLGAKALFEEKYGDVVRVLEIPGYSTELCGGTHVEATGEVGLVKILRDEGIGSGVRRINAVAGKVSLGIFQNLGQTLKKLSDIMSADMDSISSKVEEILDEKRILERRNHDLMLREILKNVGTRVEDAPSIDGIKVVVDRFDDIPKDLLREMGDRVRQVAPESVTLLASVEKGQVSIVCMASDQAVKKGAHAGNLVKQVAALLGGSGGGRPSMGQAGSKDATKLREALGAAEEILRAQLAG